MGAVAVEAVIRQAEFGPPVTREADCSECLDSGVSGATAWTPGGRCETCRGPGLVTRALRRTPLGSILAAAPRTL
jgi:DnaJ-class molecular chaperone